MAVFSVFWPLVRWRSVSSNVFKRSPSETKDPDGFVYLFLYRNIKLQLIVNKTPRSFPKKIRLASAFLPTYIKPLFIIVIHERRQSRT